MNAVPDSLTAQPVQPVQPAQPARSRASAGGTGRGRGRRLGLLDRAWLGSWSSLFAGPIDPKPIEEIRAAVGQVLARHPEHAVVSHLDTAARRWRPVPVGDSSAHCAQIVAAVSDPAPDEADDFINAHVPTDTWPAPFRLLVGPRTATLHMSHALGDARTVTRLMHALLTADVEELSALEPRAHWGTVAAGLVSDVRQRRARYRRPDGPKAHPGPAGTAPAGPDAAHLVSQVIDNNAVRELMRWRKQNASGVALTSLLTSAMFLALVDQGLPIDRSGYHGLVDARRYLRPGDQARAGNLAKSLFFAVDPADPRAVEAVFSSTLDSGWALPSTLYGTLVTALRPRPADAHAGGDGRAAVSPISISVSIVPSLPGLDAFPWSGPGQPRFIGVGSPHVGPSLNLFAVRLRSHLEVAATFRSAAVPADKVRAALAALADPAAVLASHTAGPDGARV